ncbi:hypothetical protein FRB93_011932 [Tulasnella sp. JGI-2019a]|nr:hypothetical protein FRB93_011932 [Tulasnella sp. JGI-2019a]
MADRCRSVQQWALNITTKLSNDPTRPAFKEFVQVHGFLFLEEFLEDALRGPKDQTVVDLAKTPGRRKDVPKTTRAAAVAMAASQKKIKALHFSMEDNKENQPQPSTTAIANQNFQRASPVKGQNGKEKGIDVDGGHYSGEDSSKRPFQPKVAFTSGESLTQKITMAPINHASRSTTPGHTTAKYLPTAPLPEYVHEESSESLKHVAEGSEGPEEPISTNNEFMYQELSVIEEDDDMDLTMIQPPSQSLERTLIQTDVPTVFQSTTAALDAPVVSQNTIAAASTAVPSRHALFIDPITTPEASTSSARPVPIATNTPSSPPKHDPRVQSEAIASGPIPGLASSPSFQSSETSNAVSVVPATSAHVQPVLQLKSTAEQPLQTNPAGPSTASLTHATSVPDLNLDTHDAPAPHQPPQVRSSWLREALLPAVPKQSMGAALIAQAKKSMGVRPSGLGIGMARASGVKRKSDSIDFDDRREERKSKSFKTSHYGGGMKTSEALVPVVTAKTTAATSNEKPVPFKEDESEMSDFEVEVGGQDDDEDKTTFSKLAETIRDENNKRLARSIVHQQGDTVKDAPLKKIAHYPIDIDLTGRFNIPIPSPSETTPVSTPVAAAVVNPTEAISDINTTTSSQPHMSAVPALPVAQQKRSLPHERLSISELVNSSQSNGRMKPKQNAKVQEGGVTGGAKPFTLLVDSIASTTTPENSPPKANSSIISTSHQIQTATTTTVAIVQAQVPEGAAADPPLFLGRDKVVTPVVPKDSRDAPYKDLSLFEEMVFGIGGKKAQHTPVSGSVQPPTNPAAPVNVPAREATNPSTLSRAPLVLVDKTLTSNVYPFETLPPARGPTLANAQQDPLSRQATFASQTSTQSSFADSIFATSQPMARTHAYNPEMDPFSQTSTQPTEYMESQEDSIPQSKGKGRQVVPPAETPAAKHPVPPTVGLRGHNIFSNDGDENEVDRGVNADRSGSDTEEEVSQAFQQSMTRLPC